MYMGGILQFTIFLCFFLFSVPVQAQEDEVGGKEVSINSNRKLKNEIGVDIAPLEFLLNSSSANYPSLFYRRHFSKKREVKSMNGMYVTSYHAYRIRFGSNLSFQKLDVPDIKSRPIENNQYPYYNRSLTETSSVFVRVGKERQFRFSKFELFYGYDLYFHYDRYTDYYMYSQLHYINSVDEYFSNQSWGYESVKLKGGLAAIGGFKYFLLPRLCFSAEATFNIGYSSEKKDNVYERYSSDNDTYLKQDSSIELKGATTSIIPLYVINIGFYF